MTKKNHRKKNKDYSLIKPKKRKKRSKRLRKAGSVKPPPLRHEYLNVINQSVKSMLRSEEDVFTTSDLNLLIGGNGRTEGIILKGIMNELSAKSRPEYTIDPGCNSMCLTIALISWSILDKRFEQLSVQEKLFLFCVDYLSKEEDLENDILPEIYAIRKLDMEMKLIELYYKNKVDQGASPRIIKRALNNVEKAITHRDSILSNYKEGTGQLYVNVCDELDCRFINKDEMSTPELGLSIMKLCKYLVIMFKGLLVQNMEVIRGNNKYTNKITCRNKDCLGNGVEFDTNELLEKHMVVHNENTDLRMYVSFDIKEILLKTEAVIMPLIDCYINSKDTDGYIDEWVYLCDSSSRTVKKVMVSDLKTDRHYVCATLDIDFIMKSSENETIKPTNIGEYIDKIIREYILRSTDTLSYIEIEDKKLGNGSVRSNLTEVFEGTTHGLIEHWFVSSKTVIENECIDIAVEILT